MHETSIIMLGLLREAKFGWIADELAEALALGKQIEKDFTEGDSKRKSRGTTVVPYSDKEELSLIVETLAQYFFIMPQAWAEAQKLFSAENTFRYVAPIKPRHQSMHVDDGPPEHGVVLGFSSEDGEPFIDFAPDYYAKAAPSLWQALAQLWPAGIDDFSARYPLPEAKK